jgi:hypothetical protein
MGLPTSRDETLTDASKVRAALLNKLQDCIVGQKRPSTPIRIPGLGFTLWAGAPTRFGNVWTFPTPSVHTVTAPLLLPIGTRITDVVWSAIFADVVSGLIRAPISGVTTNLIASFRVAGGATWTERNVLTAGNLDVTNNLPHVLETGWNYWVAATGGYGGLGVESKFDGCTITYDRL